MPTALNLLNALVDRLANNLKNFPSINEEILKFNIYRHKVPERVTNRAKVKGAEGAQNDVFPFCVVKIDTGHKERNVSNQVTAVNIFIGVKNEAYEGQGYDDVLACIQRIWNDLNDKPIVGSFFKLKDELDWALNDDDAESHPFYYGVIRLAFESPSMQYVGGYESGERY